MPLKPVMKPLKLVEKKIMLVEGDDEVKFFETLLSHLKLSAVQVIEVGGNKQFKNRFPAFLKGPNFPQVTSYAIIRDAEDNYVAVKDSIQTLLKRNDQPCPLDHGKFAIKNSRKVGMFIMPGKKEATGMLEDLCLRTVVEHPVMSCVEGYMRCLSEKLARRTAESAIKGKFYYPKNESKAKVQVYLAGMEDLVYRVGLAAPKGYWTFDHPAFTELRDFVNEFVR